MTIAAKCPLCAHILSDGTCLNCGWIASPPFDAGPVRNYHVGKSDYSQHKIQPWDIWLEYKLDPWDADIIKRVLRKKEGEPRVQDYKKIIHVCKEKIRQLEEKI